jgi:D-lactate dehydrogenase (cytochrome)
VELQDELRSNGLYYPPVPTYQDAMLGGTVSTNAGGAATFKYGVTRQWVHGIRVLLFNGDLLEIERGTFLARRGESFLIVLSNGRTLEVPVPVYPLPALKKISIGYHSADPLDLLDLFIGSEGTLGLITQVTVRTIPLRETVFSGLAFPSSNQAALRLAGELRAAAVRCREINDPLGPDIRAVEWVDSRCLALLKEYGDLADLKLRLPDGAGSAVLLEMELEGALGQEEVLDLLSGYMEDRPGLPDGPVVRLFKILDKAGCLESLLPALPGDEKTREQLRRFRESVPLRVNEILASRREAAAGPRKVGGDLIVPFDRLEEFVAGVEKQFESRGLEFAIWGHLSDGNLHPNVLPADAAQVQAGEEALLALGELAASLGGCPLSEHGVGRSRLKQELMRRFLGKEAVLEMKAVKAALDPTGRFSPGTIFPAIEP